MTELKAAIMEGAVMRIRPKAMTVAVVIGGLLPIMFSAGTGSEVMRRIAAPMVGGMITASLLSLFVVRRSTCSGNSAHWRWHPGAGVTRASRPCVPLPSPSSIGSLGGTARSPSSCPVNGPVQQRWRQRATSVRPQGAS